MKQVVWEATFVKSGGILKLRAVLQSDSMEYIIETIVETTDELESVDWELAQHTTRTTEVQNDRPIQTGCS